METNLVTLAVGVASAYVSANQVPAQSVPELVRDLHKTLSALADGPKSEPHQAPAVRIGKSVHDDYIVCLEDGKKLKMLKRYLARKYSMTPESYRQKWCLPVDYPMVAPAYARLRSDFAKSIGLGTKPGPRNRRGGRKAKP